MPSPAKPRLAFTLIELLVVISIIAILLAMLIPAVGRIRESAYRTRCLNQVKNVTLGLTNYATKVGYYPFSMTTSAPRHSWTPYVLNALGEQGLYDRYDLSKNWNHDDNKGVIGSRITLLQCPSAPDDRAFPDGSQAWTDYTSISARDNPDVQMRTKWVKFDRAGNPDPDYPTYPNAAAALGIMVADYENNKVHVRPGDVSDGLSSTLLVVESAGRPQWWKTGGVQWAGPPGTKIEAGKWADPRSEIVLDGAPLDGWDQIGGPCPMNCTSNNEIYSFHRGGACIGFADGQARFLRDDLSNKIVLALISRAGGDQRYTANVFD